MTYKQYAIRFGIYIAVLFLIGQTTEHYLYLPSTSYAQVITSSSPPSSSTTTAQDFSTYKNSRLGINIQFPSDWNLINKPFGDNTVRFNFVQPGAKYAPWLDIFVYTPGSLPSYPSADTQLSDVVKGFISDWESRLTDFKLINQTNGPTIDGNPSISVTYTYSDAAVGSTNMHSILTKDGDNLYYFAYGSKPDSFNKYLSTADEIISSFHSSANQQIPQQ
jgi:hypothetical protein